MKTNIKSEIHEVEFLHTKFSYDLMLTAYGVDYVNNLRKLVTHSKNENTYFFVYLDESNLVAVVTVSYGSKSSLVTESTIIDLVFLPIDLCKNIFIYASPSLVQSGSILEGKIINYIMYLNDMLSNI